MLYEIYHVMSYLIRSDQIMYNRYRHIDIYIIYIYYNIYIVSPKKEAAICRLDVGLFGQHEIAQPNRFVEALPGNGVFLRYQRQNKC